jgi:excisionase family DNA binding protein
MHHKDGVSAKKRERMLTTGKVSRLLHIHPNTVRQWSDKGYIRTYRIGTRADRRFKQDDVRRFLVQLRKNGGTPKKVE